MSVRLPHTRDVRQKNPLLKGYGKYDSLEKRQTLIMQENKVPFREDVKRYSRFVMTDRI
jgi:hypothetical protein